MGISPAPATRSTASASTRPPSRPGSPWSPTATPPRTSKPSPSCRATASERLDTLPGIADGYVLEVTSPGVDRPLTAEKHFRRARGRKVELTLSDGVRVAGRIAGLDDGVLRLVVRATARAPWSVREIAFRRCRRSRCPSGIFAALPAVNSSWSVSPRAMPERRHEHEHRHGRAACDRGGPRHRGGRAARDHRDRAADRLPAHRGPSGRRAHRHRPQDRCGAR